MSPLQEALVEKAERALATARQVVGEDPEAAVNRAYYACFYLAQAALLDVGEEPKSHAGTHNRFAFHFVATGRIPENVARTLPYAAQARERADYNALVVTDSRAAADLLADAERFVAAVRTVLGEGTEA
jgi:uncharacterized protein (UPF0332 family)